MFKRSRKPNHKSKLDSMARAYYGKNYNRLSEEEKQELVRLLM